MTGVRTVVHIGADKTGSTAIQQAMATNRDQLLALGVWYPDLDGRPDHRLLSVSPSIAADLSAGIDPGIDHIVVSAEALWAADRTTIDQLLRALRSEPAEPIVVVGFLRDPVDHADAAFGQRLRLCRSEAELRAVLAVRSIPAPINPIAGRAQRRLAQLERWIAAVDAANTAANTAAGPTGARRAAVELVICRYRPTGDVVVELCHAVGLDRLIPALAERSDPRPNPRLGLDAIHASILVRQRSGAVAQSRFVEAVTAAPDPAGHDVALLPPPLRARIQQRTGPVLGRLEHRITEPAPGNEPPPASPDPGTAKWPSAATLAQPEGMDRLDRGRARALVSEIWPDFPAGGPNRST